MGAPFRRVRSSGTMVPWSYHVVLDVTAAQGTLLAILPYVLHRQQKYWGSDADDFRPERHLERDGKAMPPFAFLPFIAGPRSCIGSRFAVLEMKVRWLLQCNGEVMELPVVWLQEPEHLCVNVLMCVYVRVCIICMGACALVQTLQQTVLAVIMSTFTLQLKPGAAVSPRLRITMYPAPGLPMLLRRNDT